MALDITGNSEIEKHMGPEWLSGIISRMGYQPPGYTPHLAGGLEGDVRAHFMLSATSIESVARLYNALEVLDSEGKLDEFPRIKESYKRAGWLIAEATVIDAIQEKRLDEVITEHSPEPDALRAFLSGKPTGIDALDALQPNRPGATPPVIKDDRSFGRD